MFQRDLIIFFGLFVFVAWAQEAPQNTNSTDVNQDPRRIPTNNHRVNRHNWPSHRAGRVPHSPDVFQRMRQIEENKHHPHQHQHQQQEILAVTELPVAVTEAPQQKAEEHTAHEQNEAPEPTKIKGGSFEQQKEQMLLNRGENPWMRMHSGPMMRPQQIHERVERAKFEDAPSGLVHFSSGTATTTNENTQTASQPESNTETQQKAQVFPPVHPNPFMNHHRLPFLENNDAKLTQKQSSLWNRDGSQMEKIVPHVAETGNVDDFKPFTRDHFFKFNRFQSRNAIDPALNTRDGNVIRMTNRPPDIIIRNTFQDRPKSFIDLRISIDDNGVLNVEAGPQGIVKNRNSTSSSNVNGASNADDQIEDEDMDLEEHWARNRQMKNLHHVSGMWGQDDHGFDQHHGPMMRDKRIPFWVLRGGPNNHAPRFGHGPLPMFEDKLGQKVGEVSQSVSENQGRSQLQISGGSHPPVTPADEMQGPREQRKNENSVEPEQNKNNNDQIQRISKLGQRQAAQDPIDEPMVNEIIQEAAAKNMTPTGPNSAHANDQEDVNQQQQTPEPEIKPVINIDDFSASGCPALNCSKKCPGGLTKLDQENGCPMCDCCPDIACRQTCASGYDSDQFGCPICRCV